MPRLRETLNPEETQFQVARLTRVKTAKNKHPLPCSDCAEIYYVDDLTYHEFIHAIEFDASDNMFVCDRCLEQRSEEEHPRT
jgi:hypothetical protein